MAATLSAAFTPTPLAAGERIVIEATRQLSQGINFVPRSEYKTVFVGTAASASPANLLTAYTALYGSLAAGMRIFVRASVIGSTGFKSAYRESSIVVT